MGVCMTKTVTVDVDFEMEPDEILEALKDTHINKLGELLEDLSFKLTFDGITAEEAYYAMARGDMEPARRFITAAAGKIA